MSDLDTETPLVGSMDSFAEDYSHMLDLDVGNQVSGLEAQAEELLSRLDELLSIVDKVRGDTGDALCHVAPQLLSKTESLKELFGRVDDLEIFVQVVRQKVDLADKKVSEAEDEMYKFRKVLKSLPGLWNRNVMNARHDPGSGPESGFDPTIELFSTSDYFTEETRD